MSLSLLSIGCHKEEETYRERSEESIEDPCMNIENNSSEHYGLEEEVTSKMECQQCSKEDAPMIF